MLDLARVASQMTGMVDSLVQGSEGRRQHREKALALMAGASLDLERLKRRAQLAKTTWLVGVPAEPLATHLAPSLSPPDFTVLATDGSHIDVDRHTSARCALLNTGLVRLDYGGHPGATLESLPRLLCGRELQLTDGIHEQAVEGNLLAALRAVAELRALVDLTAQVPVERPALALMDGSLILWGLTGEKIPDFVLRELLDEGYLKALNDMKQTAATHRAALASYISFPRSTDVVNTLRVALCPHEIPDCDRYCTELAGDSQPCAGVSGVQDAEVFQGLLGPGERSALFISQSRIVREHYPSPVYFFYLNIGDEMARVEVPEWLAADAARLGMAQSIILDQCRRGQGYPVALSEAHEQAVVNTTDRQGFQKLLETLLVSAGVETTGSAKSRSKKTRWL